MPLNENRNVGDEGHVLDHNDIADQLNDLPSTYSQFLQGTAIARPAAGTPGRIYTATDTGTVSVDTGSTWKDVPPTSAVVLRADPGHAFTLASEATTSTTYVNLATVGPTVTLTRRALGSGRCLVLLHAFISPGAINRIGYMGVAVSGATTIAADDIHAIALQAYTAGSQGRISAAFYLDINEGSNTFTAKYRSSDGGTVTFADRLMTVFPL